MRSTMTRLAVIASLFLRVPAPGYAQSAELVRFENMSPRELRGASFTLPVAQVVEIQATGANEWFGDSSSLIVINGRIDKHVFGRWRELARQCLDP